MPYLPSDAKKKSELYDNVLSGDVLEYQNEIEDLKKSLNISGSVVDAKQPLRDSSGVLQSFESRVDGVSLEEDFQQVRLENKQQYFVGELDNSFSFFFDEEQQGQETTDSDTTTEEQISTEEVEFQATIRDYLIQFVNEHFKEENTPDISTDRLHEKLTEFFKTEYDRYIGKAYGGTLMGLVTTLIPMMTVMVYSTVSPGRRNSPPVKLTTVLVEVERSGSPLTATTVASSGVLVVGSSLTTLRGPSATAVA